MEVEQSSFTFDGGPSSETEPPSSPTPSSSSRFAFDEGRKSWHYPTLVTASNGRQEPEGRTDFRPLPRRPLKLREYQSRVSSRKDAGTSTTNSSYTSGTGSSSLSSRTLFSSSSPLSGTSDYLRNRSIQNALLQRAVSSRPKTKRNLDLIDSNPFATESVGFGGLRKGEWEEYTDDELKLLEYWTQKQARIARNEWEQKWNNEAGTFSQDGQEDEMMEEPESTAREWREEPPSPPSDLTDEEELYERHVSNHSIPDLPPLASQSAFSSSPSSTSPTMEGGDEEEEGEDVVISHVGGITSNLIGQNNAQSIYETFLSTTCPACKKALLTITSEGSLRCSQPNCLPWTLNTPSTEALIRVFSRHHQNTFLHRPLIFWTEATGTLIMCEGCDEEFAV